MKSRIKSPRRRNEVYPANMLNLHNQAAQQPSKASGLRSKSLQFPRFESTRLRLKQSLYPSDDFQTRLDLYERLPGRTLMQTNQDAQFAQSQVIRQERREMIDEMRAEFLIKNCLDPYHNLKTVGAPHHNSQFRAPQNAGRSEFDPYRVQEFSPLQLPPRQRFQPQNSQRNQIISPQFLADVGQSLSSPQFLQQSLISNVPRRRHTNSQQSNDQRRKRRGLTASVQPQQMNYFSEPQNDFEGETFGQMQQNNANREMYHLLNPEPLSYHQMKDQLLMSALQEEQAYPYEYQYANQQVTHFLQHQVRTNDQSKIKNAPALVEQLKVERKVDSKLPKVVQQTSTSQYIFQNEDIFLEVADDQELGQFKDLLGNTTRNKEQLEQQEMQQDGQEQQNDQYKVVHEVQETVQYQEQQTESQNESQIIAKSFNQQTQTMVDAQTFYVFDTKVKNNIVPELKQVTEQQIVADNHIVSNLNALALKQNESQLSSEISSTNVYDDQSNLNTKLEDKISKQQIVSQSVVDQQENSKPTTIQQNFIKIESMVPGNTTDFRVCEAINESQRSDESNQHTSNDQPQQNNNKSSVQTSPQQSDNLKRILGGLVDQMVDSPAVQSTKLVLPLNAFSRHQEQLPAFPNSVPTQSNPMRSIPKTESRLKNSILPDELEDSDSSGQQMMPQTMKEMREKYHDSTFNQDSSLAAPVSYDVVNPKDSKSYEEFDDDAKTNADKQLFNRQVMQAIAPRTNIGGLVPTGSNINLMWQQQDFSANSSAMSTPQVFGTKQVHLPAKSRLVGAHQAEESSSEQESK